MKKIIFSALALVALASCSKETTEVTTFDDNMVRLSSGIDTRASGTKWSAGDAISVFAYYTGTTSDVIAENAQHTANSSSTSSLFTPYSSSDYFYYPTDGNNIDLYAIYPYNSSTTLIDYSIDVSTAMQSDHTQIDLMSATVTGQARSADAVNMTFTHKLAQIQITLSAAENGGLTDDDLASSEITLGGTIVSGSYNVLTDKISADGDINDIEITAVDKVATFMVIPQSATPVFTITIGDTKYSATASTFTMDSNCIYSYDITVSKTAISISGATINPWDTTNNDSLNATEYEDVNTTGYTLPTILSATQNSSGTITVTFDTTTFDADLTVITLCQTDGTTLGTNFTSSYLVNSLSGVLTTNTTSYPDGKFYYYAVFYDSDSATSTYLYNEGFEITVEE